MADVYSVLARDGSPFSSKFANDRASQIIDTYLQNPELKSTRSEIIKRNWSAKSFPKPLRKIRFYDSENKVMLVLLTNHFSLTPETAAQLYKKRWQIELFFKWIKQHLRLRAFYGRSENAVRCQIWSALCSYLLVAILKRQNGIEKSLNEILQIVSVNIFEQAPAVEILATIMGSIALASDQSDLQNHFEFNNI